jgi:ABC-type spermidine/putrescine transport system, permease component II
VAGRLPGALAVAQAGHLRQRGLVFSGVIDDFVLVDLLSSNSGNTPMSVYIYSQQRGGNGGPALNALGTIMLACRSSSRSSATSVTGS